METQEPNPPPAETRQIVAADPIDAQLAKKERLLPPEGANRLAPDPTYGPHPSFFFLALVSALAFGADIGSKNWVQDRLHGYPGVLTLVDNFAEFVLARNKGGAWGILQDADEAVRRPFFLVVSAAAILFIVSLYRRLHPKQRALTWGLPLVLGGALGNVFDRIRYGHVIDFIHVHAAWGGRDHHWPTFNVADIAISVGVGLMALDMFTSRRSPPAPGTGRSLKPPAKPATVDVAPPMVSAAPAEEPAAPETRTGDAT